MGQISIIIYVICGYNIISGLCLLYWKFYKLQSNEIEILRTSLSWYDIAFIPDQNDRAISCE